MIPRLGRRRIYLVICLLIITCIILATFNSETNNRIKVEADHILHHLSDIDSKTKDAASSKLWDEKEKNGDSTNMEREAKDEKPLDPCTIINKRTNQFYDLRSLGALGLESETQAWNAKGFDYGRNFSIGICSTPLRQIKPLSSEDFLDISNKSDVGAYYTNDKGVKVSMGLVSTDLKFRGNKLILEYDYGDKCQNIFDSNGEPLRKETLLTFTCDREMMSKARVNFLGSLHNCSYFFEVRTIHACATAPDENDTAIWGIFVVILMSALGVYFCAGIIYKLIKTHYEKVNKRDVESGVAYKD